jgi:ribosomal protein S18 acetylase RimI-like enzyme
VVPAIADGVPHAGLTELYVREQDRRRGIGRVLVSAAEAHAQSHGAPELWLVTGFDNAQAQAFYRALGYADRALTMFKPLA